jgi:hypothetical protein
MPQLQDNDSSSMTSIVSASSDKRARECFFKKRQNFESPSGNRVLERVGFQQYFATSGSPLREAPHCWKS